jgi:hypothetical protein
MYQKFKEALLNTTTKEHREEIMDRAEIMECGSDYYARYINLEDVLMALDYKITVYYGHPIINKEVQWQLGKPAHRQSDETLEAIYNLLK